MQPGVELLYAVLTCKAWSSGVNTSSVVAHCIDVCNLEQLVLEDTVVAFSAWSNHFYHHYTLWLRVHLDVLVVQCILLLLCNIVTSEQSVVLILKLIIIVHC